MYCPVCGDQSTQGLNYCKRCGASLLTQPSGQTERPSFKPMSLLIPVAAVSITGLIAFFMTISNLAWKGVDGRTVVGIAAFGGATVVAVVGSLIWLLLRIFAIPQPPKFEGRVRAANEVHFPEKQRVLLGESDVSVPSVTENTTRSFDQLKARDHTNH